MSFANIHVDVEDEEPPKFHCVYDHKPGEFSVKAADKGDITIYISGTFTQLRDWATQFTAALVDGRSALDEQERDTTND
jgi:hypothetical protein